MLRVGLLMASSAGDVSCSGPSTSVRATHRSSLQMPSRLMPRLDVCSNRSTRLRIIERLRAAQLSELARHEAQFRSFHLANEGYGLITEGIRNKVIASALFISPSTTKVHVRNS